ncbi:MAG: hypothetical protein O2816_07940 [Planctomycetota bacterium]|nr:hypothetical protein [Planctomycetota bacterium]
MTLIEVMISILILTVAVYLLSSTVTAAIGHSEVKRERGIAVEAAANLIEQLHAQEFEDLWALYNEDPSDDPQGSGTAPGRHFAVPGLDAMEADVDGLVGEVVMPVKKSEPGFALREDEIAAELGLPRDLNGDLLIDDQDHSGDYIVLPVIVRVSWTGKAGNRQFEIATMLAKLKKAPE